MAASRAVFKDPDVDAPEAQSPRSAPPQSGSKARKQTNTQKTERSARRARSQLREYALANEWDWFVTLTLDKTKIDRYDIAEITKKLNSWLSNQVKRYGLKYVLIPELHKDGGVHFHGLFSGGSLAPCCSGHVDRGGHDVYNLERWPYGFTTAIRLYGEFERAVGYVCKYIGKGFAEKPIGGRWYYHGGQLKKACVTYADISPDELRQSNPDGYEFQIMETGTEFYMVKSHSDEISRPEADREQAVDILGTGN